MSRRFDRLESERRVARYRDAHMALRWMAVGFLQTEKSFRRIRGHRDLWGVRCSTGKNRRKY